MTIEVACVVVVLTIVLAFGAQVWLVRSAERRDAQKLAEHLMRRELREFLKGRAEVD
jgi:hypothetical protein